MNSTELRTKVVDKNAPSGKACLKLKTQGEVDIFLQRSQIDQLYVALDWHADDSHRSLAESPAPTST